MTCPKCGGKTKVVDVVHNLEDGETYRKRICESCSDKFFTVESEIKYDEIREEWNEYLRGKEKK